MLPGTESALIFEAAAPGGVLVLPVEALDPGRVLTQYVHIDWITSLICARDGTG